MTVNFSHHQAVMNYRPLQENCRGTSIILNIIECYEKLS